MRPTPEDPEAHRSPLVPLWVALVALLPVLGLFTTRNIFFIRDLSFFFWSRHLWLRHTIFAGSFPWWDPYVAGGQSAIADALHQLLMPITLAVRLLPSDVVSFNLWVALPLPVAAIGTYLFLRRDGDPAAALGAGVFALAGPTASSLTAPNLSWSVALLPWVLWAAGDDGSRIEDRGSRIDPVARTTPKRSSNLEPRTSTRTAIAFALQGLCGEPVTWLATGVLVLAWTRSPRVAIGLLAGAGLAAAQLVPTLLAGIHAERTALATPDFWSLHPVSLWELVAPHLFGNFQASTLAGLPWMGALNFGRDPFFYSLYVGPLVLMLAVIGAGTRGRSLFWIAVAVTALIAALGGYTPLFPLVRRAVPELLYFRFPVKYIVFTVFACAMLAARGITAIAGLRSRWTWPAVAGVALLLSLIALLWPGATTRAAYWLALATHLKDPAGGAAFLASTAPPLAIRASAFLAAGALLVSVAPRWKPAVWLLAALTCADLALANRDLNPTTPVDRLSPPAWYVASAGVERLYIGGRVRGFMNVDDPDGTPPSQVPPDTPSIERRAELNAELPLAPSGWGVREALSYDLPYLWPAEYEAVVKQFERAGPDARAAFLRRSGVRRCVLPATRSMAFTPVTQVPDWGMQVVECNPAAVRAFIASPVETPPDGADAGWQRAALFDVSLGDTAARVAAVPPAAGSPSPAGPSAVRIVEDRTAAVTIDATLARPGLLVLRDSYDPSWRAEADGMPAAIVRANGLYRAVSLPAGRHVIRFAYRPRQLAIGLIISGATVVMLLAGRFVRVRRSRTDAGFTLIELMVVLAIIAILLAVAFTEYRGMQARGNEASALASMRSIAVAQWQFALTCGNMHYVTKLTDLAVPVPSTGQNFLSPDLTGADSFEKSGYAFQMTAKPLDDARPACNGTAVAAGYAATADPTRPGVTGTTFFAINADRILYIDEEKTFTGTMPESGAPDHGSEVKK